jgi:hypothetical protein
MARRGQVVSHWYTLVDNFNTSALDFYGAVEAVVRARAVPKAEFSRVPFKEGGFASAWREYLRVERGNVAFDIGAAPYGKGYFFSWWMSQLGPKHPLLYLLAFMLCLGAAGASAWQMRISPYSQWQLALLAILIVSSALALLARYRVFGPEENILAVPVIGWIYDKLFSPITYYSLDTALMFQESIRRSVNEVIDELLEGQGLRALSEDEKRPTIRDLVR